VKIKAWLLLGWELGGTGRSMAITGSVACSQSSLQVSHIADFFLRIGASVEGHGLVTNSFPLPTLSFFWTRLPYLDLLMLSGMVLHP